MRARVCAAAAALAGGAAGHDAALGFADLAWNTSYDRVPLKVRGDMPTWLDGAYFRGSPSRFPDQWMFNALMTRHAWYFKGGQVEYSMRFVQSDNYNASAAAAGANASAGTPAPPPLRAGARGLPVPGMEDTSFDSDIAFLQIQGAATGGAIVGVTGMSHPNSFDRDTLAMREAPFRFRDAMANESRTATGFAGPWLGPTHAQIDKNGWYLHHRADTMFTTAGEQPKYVVWQIAPGSRERELIAEIPVNWTVPPPAFGQPGVGGTRYQHDQAVTEDHYIMLEAPCFYPQPYPNDWGGFTWEGDLGTNVRVIDRKTGANTVYPLSENIYGVHIHNAYVRPNTSTLVFDFAGYPLPCTINMGDTNVTAMRLDDARHIRETFVGPSAAATAVRLEIPLDRPGATVPVRAVSNFTGMDMQAIHYEKHNGRPYRYVYGLSFREPGRVLGAGKVGSGRSIYYDQIVKMDYETGETWTWSPDPVFRAFPGEAYFVPSPGAAREDDGVLLTVVLDGAAAESHLYVLNATTMTPIATAGPTPHYVNHGYHGRYMPTGFNFN